MRNLYYTIIKNIVYSLLLFLFNNVTAQSTSLTLSWSFQTNNTNDVSLNSVKQTSDGGFVGVGYSTALGNDSIGTTGNYYWITKTDSLGHTQWQKRYGGNNNDTAFSVQQTIDGGYIVAGSTSSTNGNVTGHHGKSPNSDYWILKLNSLGSIVWEKCYGGSGDDMARTIEQTTDGGFIVAGYSNSSDGDVTGNHGSYDYWVIKINNLGQIVWQKSLGGSGDDEAMSMKYTSDRGCIISGESSSLDGNVSGNYGGYDAWVVKLTETGNIAWSKCYGGTLDEYANSIQQTKEGGYIFEGYADFLDQGGNLPNANNSWQVFGGNIWIVKLDTSGLIKWQQSVGVNCNCEYSYPTEVLLTADGGYLVGGNSPSIYGDPYSCSNNAGIAKLDSLGNYIWNATVSGICWGPNSFQQSTKGGFIFAGSGYFPSQPFGGGGGYFFPELDYYLFDTTLPIVTKNITANNFNSGIRVQWQTVTELNTANFIIQHSTDGNSYTDIGTVKAIGSGANSYSFIDNNPANGINYYRLQSVDKDWATSFSKVVSASLTNIHSRLTIYPNPTKDNVTISGNHIASVQVIDNFERVVKVVSLKDVTNPKLSVSGMAAGVYHLRIQTTDGKVSRVGMVKE